MNKEKYLEMILNAARDRADYLEELASECIGDEDNAARVDYLEQAEDIRLACAELDKN